MARKAPNIATLRRLFALSGNKCAFPGCSHELINNEGVYTAQLCHIEAAEEGGQRFNKNQTVEDRRGFENLLLMCHKHHKITDNIEKYSVEKLKEIKFNHESRFESNLYQISNNILDNVLDSIEDQLSMIIDQNKQTHQSLNSIITEISTLKEERNKVVIGNTNLNSSFLKIGLKLRKQKKLTSAIEYFKTLEMETWDDYTEEEKFKLLANIGVTYLDLGETDQAISYFLKISKLSFESTDSLSYTCLAYALLKDEEKFHYFFDRTLKIDQDNNENLWIAYLLIKGSNNPVANIIDRIPQKFLKSDFIAIKLLELYYKENKEQEASQILWQIEASINSQDYNEWQIILTYLGILLANTLTVEKLQFKQFSQEETALIEKAVLLYTRVINFFKDGNSPKVLSTVYYNRGLCYMALSKISEMDLDYNKSWSLSNSFYAFKSLFLTAIDSNKLDTCELLIERWKLNKMSTQEKFETLICEGRLKALQGNMVQFEAILLDGYNKMGEEFKPLVLDNLILNATRLKDYPLVLKYSNMLIAEFPQFIYGYIGLYIYYMEEKNYSLALSNLNETRDKKYDERSEKFIWLQIADGYYQLKEYKIALEYYDKLKKYKNFHLIKVTSAECHYHLNNFSEVIELLKDTNIIESDFGSPQILFWSYYKLHQLEQSLKVLEKGLEREKRKEVEFFKKIASMYYSENDQFEKARKMILSIEDFRNFEVAEAFDMVGLLHSMGYKLDSFDLACKLRYIFYDTFEAQNYFVELYLLDPNFFSKNQLFLKNVTENSLVVLTDEENTKLKFLLSDKIRVSQGVTLKNDDLLWTRLIDAKKGDIIEIPNNMGKFKIKKIWSKYLIGIRDSLYLLKNKYSDKTKIYFGKFSN